MGSGPWRPGQRPARGFHPPERPLAFVPDIAPPAVSGAQFRRGYAASRHPSRRFRFPQRPRAHEVYGGGSGGIAAFGAAGAATFVLSLEPGTKLTLTWSTDIYRSYSGNEQRSSPFPLPKQRIEGVAFLVDAGSRDARGALQRAAAAGSTFMLAVPYEETIIAADTIAATVAVLSVGSTLGLDWALAGQRVIVIGVDGAVVYAVIQSVTATTISVIVSDRTGTLTFAQLGTAGRAGGRVMPLLQVLLDPSQGFARYPVTVDLWSIHATAAVFGWTGADSMGLGARVYTYTAAGTVAATSVTEADLLVWDRPNLMNGTANEAMLSGAEALDLGALPTGFGDQTVPDWGRSIRYESSDPAEWQWLKAFLRLCRGRQRPFLLSTNRDDLVYVSGVTNGIKVQSSSVAGGGDYASFYTSLAHRRLAFTDAAGAVTYSTVTSAPVDNGDGTLTVLLDAAPTTAPARISIAEQLRIDNDGKDDIDVTWDGGTFSVDVVARAVQETIIPPLAFMFDTYFSQTFAFPPPPPTPPTDQEFAVTALGAATLFYFASDRSLSFGGIATSVPLVDGMILCVVNTNNNAFSMTIIHEDTTWPANNRILVPNLAAIGGVMRSYWFAWNTAQQRWILWKLS